MSHKTSINRIFAHLQLFCLFICCSVHDCPDNYLAWSTYTTNFCLLFTIAIILHKQLLSLHTHTHTHSYAIDSAWIIWVESSAQTSSIIWPVEQVCYCVCVNCIWYCLLRDMRLLTKSKVAFFSKLKSLGCCMLSHTNSQLSYPNDWGRVWIWLHVCYYYLLFTLISPDLQLVYISNNLKQEKLNFEFAHWVGLWSLNMWNWSFFLAI